jgi:hypothetical protein
MQTGTQMVFEAINEALRAVGVPLAPTAAETAAETAALNDERLAEAARKVRELRARLVQEAMALPTAPPPGAAAAGGSPPASANGA